MAYLRAYMRGDPGLGSFFKKLGRGALKVAKFVVPVAAAANSKVGLKLGAGFIPGVGGVASRLLSAGSTDISGAGIPAPTGIISGSTSVGQELVKGLRGAAGQYLRDRFFSQNNLPVPRGPDFGGVISGSSSTAVRVIPARRYRRMNVTNVRALRRSIRRVKGFAKIARASLVLERKVRVPKRIRSRR